MTLTPLDAEKHLEATPPSRIIVRVTHNYTNGSITLYTFVIVVQRRALDKAGASVIDCIVCIEFEVTIIISVEKRAVHSSIGEGDLLAIMVKGCGFG